MIIVIASACTRDGYFSVLEYPCVPVSDDFRKMMPCFTFSRQWIHVHASVHAVLPNFTHVLHEDGSKTLFLVPRASGSHVSVSASREEYKKI